ncbi:MAG: hypothetical protein IJW81_06355 [Clostridia bacterium]|nr:hypothetical protein [Clostridia bacterium]
MKRLLTLILASLLMLGGCVENHFAVAEADYPNAVPYPEERGDWSELAYQAWKDSRTELRKNQYVGYAEGMDAFVESAAKAILGSEKTENILYSPLNLYLTLSMLAEITEGESRTQVLDVLDLDDMEELRRKVPALWTGNYCADGTMRSVFANSVWLNESADIRTETAQTLAETYYASVYQGDVTDEDYTQAFRDWLNRNTGGLLENAVEGQAFSEETMLTLASTVDFAAEWMSGFSADATESGNFHAPSGDVSCDFMYKETDEHYYWGENFAAIRLNFNGANGNMWFILPDEDVTAADLLDDEEVSALYQGGVTNSEYLEVHMKIPKFDISADLELSECLQTLGITAVFDPKTADFSPFVSGMDGELWVNQANHAVRLAIDEEGCRAAAFTTISVSMAPPPPDEIVEITFDRPFLFVVTGNDNVTLFMGIVNNPAAN